MHSYDTFHVPYSDGSRWEFRKRIVVIIDESEQAGNVDYYASSVYDYLNNLNSYFDSNYNDYFRFDILTVVRTSNGRFRAEDFYADDYEQFADFNYLEETSLGELKFDGYRNIFDATGCIYNRAISKCYDVIAKLPAYSASWMMREIPYYRFQILLPYHTSAEAFSTTILEYGTGSIYYGYDKRTEIFDNRYDYKDAVRSLENLGWESETLSRISSYSIHIYA